MKKTKKITNKILATFFLFSILLPSISLGAEQWYFFTTAIQTSTTVFFIDKAECEAARTKAFEGKTVDPEITKCQQKVDSSNGWYFINSSGQKIGKDGEKFTELFASDTACNAGMLSYKILGKVDDNTKCIQATQEIISEIEKNKRIEAININASQPKRDDTYTLLAPIGGLTEVRDGVEIGIYLNKIFLIAIGLAGALAVVMIVIYGIMYMGDESVFGKTEAKSKIMKAIGGLILALVSYALLRTINPDLIGGKVNVGQVDIIISGDEQLFADTEPDTSSTPGFKMSGTFENPKTSSGIDGCVIKLKTGTWKIAQLSAFGNKRMGVQIKSTGNTLESCATIDVAFGANGQSEKGTGVEKDKKTPKGTHTIGSGRMDVATGTAKAIQTRPTADGKTFNLGPAMFTLSIDGASVARGIGIHGSANNTLGVTNGCIRMRNDDLVALAPYIARDKPIVLVP